MNAGLIDRWNSVVTADDQVYILGDLFFCGAIKAKAITARLNGKKYWVMGNHDWGKIKRHRCVEFGFEFMVDQFCTRIGRRHDVILNHFPYDGDHTDSDRYVEYRPKDEGGWLLHGHVHNAWKVKGRQINVGVDVWDWIPVSESALENIIYLKESLECHPRGAE